MAIRFKKRGKLARTYIAQWREYRGYTKTRLAEEMGTSIATVSRIEAGAPYSQDFLEVAAEILGCTPADLISRDPRDASQIEAALALLRRATRDNPNL